LPSLLVCAGNHQPFPTLAGNSTASLAKGEKYRTIPIGCENTSLDLDWIGTVAGNDWDHCDPGVSAGMGDLKYHRAGISNTHRESVSKFCGGSYLSARLGRCGWCRKSEESGRPVRNNEQQIFACSASDLQTIWDIINESALAYKGVIPADRWHEPYMPMAELEAEIAKGVRFYGYRNENQIIGVMGIQDVKDVTLIRHAYVCTEFRGQGIGRKLLVYLRELTSRPVLIGTWKTAVWAVCFYEKNGFALVSDEEKNRLLKIYWTVPDRQVQESVVLADGLWRARSSGCSAASTCVMSAQGA
jgi:GNAT superfamily N-acetyltransferase